MTFLSELARLREAATKGPWKRTGFSRIRGVSANGILKTEDADFICYLVNHAEAIEELVRAAENLTKDFNQFSHGRSKEEDEMIKVFAKLEKHES